MLARAACPPCACGTCRAVSLKQQSSYSAQCTVHSGLQVQVGLQAQSRPSQQHSGVQTLFNPRVMNVQQAHVWWRRRSGGAHPPELNALRHVVPRRLLVDEADGKAPDLHVVHTLQPRARHVGGQACQQEQGCVDAVLPKAAERPLAGSIAHAATSRARHIHIASHAAFSALTNMGMPQTCQMCGFTSGTRNSQSPGMPWLLVHFTKKSSCCTAQPAQC